MVEDEKDPYLAVSEKRFSSYYKDVFARELREGVQKGQAG